MYCSKCGKEVREGEKYCPNCGNNLGNSDIGKKLDEASEKIENLSKKMDKQLDSAIDDVKKSINPDSESHNTGSKRVLDTDRSLVMYILLTIITCGIYGYYFIYKLAQDINVACEGDGENTPGLATYLILSFITCGFYDLYWEYKIGNRISENAHRYGLIIEENGSSIILWRIFGALICGLGTFVGIHILLKNANTICEAYNNK